MHVPACCSSLYRRRGTIAQALGPRALHDPKRQHCWRDMRCHACHAGSGTLFLGDGGFYTGQFARGEIQGHGKRVYANGNAYEGDFAFGEPHGQGTFTSAQGWTYEGTMDHGKCSGEGTKTWAASGDGYRGAVQNGRPHGHGTLTTRDGFVHRGEWVQGAACGQGERISASGERYKARLCTVPRLRSLCAVATQVHLPDRRYASACGTLLSLCSAPSAGVCNSVQGDFENGVYKGTGTLLQPSGVFYRNCNFVAGHVVPAPALLEADWPKAGGGKAPASFDLVLGVPCSASNSVKLMVKACAPVATASTAPQQPQQRVPSGDAKGKKVAKGDTMARPGSAAQAEPAQPEPVVCEHEEWRSISVHVCRGWPGLDGARGARVAEPCMRVPVKAVNPLDLTTFDPALGACGEASAVSAPALETDTGTAGIERHDADLPPAGTAAGPPDAQAWEVVDTWTLYAQRGIAEVGDFQLGVPDSAGKQTLPAGQYTLVFESEGLPAATVPVTAIAPKAGK
jgi:hypothetical protein